VEDKELVGCADLADERDAAAVRRPFGRVVAEHTGGGLDRFRIEQAPHNDAAPVLPRAGVGPADLVRDSLPGGAQPNVVNPTKSVEVIRGDRGGHVRPVDATSSRRCRYSAL